MLFLLCSICFNVIGAVTQPFRSFVVGALSIYVSAWLLFLNSAIRVVTAPLRIVAAANRLKLVEEELLLTQSYGDQLLEQNRALERKLIEVSKDRQRVQEALDLVVVERKKCCDKLKLLLVREEELVAENRKLDEARKQQQLKAEAQRDEAHRQKESREGEGQAPGPLSSLSATLDDTLVLQGRGNAMASSLFSAALALLVSLIVWEAQDPCMPLVVALFSVVAVSLANVIQFLTKLEAKHGFDAIALMSFNWFILGTLACPAFPYVARWLPGSSGVFKVTAGWFGVSILEDVGLTEDL